MFVNGWVLLVDGDRARREHLTRMLLERCHHVTAVSHPRTALAAAVNHHYDVALILGEMPPCDCGDLTQALAMRTLNLQIIRITEDPGSDPPDLPKVGTRATVWGDAVLVEAILDAVDAAMDDAANHRQVRKSDYDDAPVNGRNRTRTERTDTAIRTSGQNKNLRRRGAPHHPTAPSLAGPASC